MEKVIKKASEYKQISALITPGLTNIIFGGLKQYKKIRKTWTYKEVKEELKELIDNNKKAIK